jgi:hypothetical protein
MTIGRRAIGRRAIGRRAIGRGEIGRMEIGRRAAERYYISRLCFAIARQFRLSTELNVN